MPRVRNLVLIALLTVAALGSWYIARSNKTEDLDQRTVDSVHRGYYLKSARILGTADNGNLLYEIRADHAEQTSGDVIRFSEVNIRYSPDSDVPWILDADTATLQYDEQRVQLEGHVLARSEEGFEGNDTEIRTQYLELDPDRYVAETDERVQIRVGARSLTATGMLASLNDDRIELKSNVRGKIAP